MLKLYNMDQKPDLFYKFKTPAYDDVEKHSTVSLNYRSAEHLTVKKN